MFAGSAAASGVVLGSGAFNFANVQRSVSVSVVDDDEAFLKLTQRGGGGRSYTDSATGTVAFEIPGSEEDEYGGTDPEGIGTDSVYRFGTDGAGDEPGLFAVENQGTDPVEVYGSQKSTNREPTVSLFDVHSSDLLTEANPSDPVGVGEKVVCGLEIDTHGVPVQEADYEVDILINAAVPEN